MIKRLCLVSCLLLIAGAASAVQPCLKYEPEVAELRGKVKKIIFPGPPNYESVKDGDEPEHYWVLFLPQAVCVEGNPKDGNK